jgi:predicted RNA-binding protein with RPS1 domain
MSSSPYRTSGQKGSWRYSGLLRRTIGKLHGLEASSRVRMNPRGEPVEPEAWSLGPAPSFRVIRALQLVPIMNETPIRRVRTMSEPPTAPGAPTPTPASPAFAAAPAAPNRPAAPPRPPRPRDDDGPQMRTMEDVDNALDAATRRGDDKPKVVEVALKRLWDDDMEAELEDAMAGFDADAFAIENKNVRTRAADRAHADKADVGQETGSGARKGKVVCVRGKTVFVDLASKSEGIIPVEQFGENPLPNPGDMIDVVVDHFDHEEGLLILSLKGAAVEADWTNLRKGLIVEARPTKVNKGGLEILVDGIRGFLPIGQIDINRVEDASIYLNQKLRVIVTEANQREKNLVVSRRDLLEKEREEQKELTWKTLEEGQVRSGVIRSVKDFGAFVDIGGVDGLIHISDLAWNRVSDVSSMVKVGQAVEVKILKIDRTTSKISLGLKQLTPSPWDTIEDRFAPGQTVKGKVTRLMDFGAFVEIEPGVEGLIHISELGPKKVFRVKDAVQVEQEVDVRILKIDYETKKIALSLRPLPFAAPPVVEEDDEDLEPVVKVERLVPLRGGLGDTDKNPFASPPK